MTHHAWDTGPEAENPCSVEGCTHPVYATGLCNGHYIRKRTGRDMNTPIRVRKNNGACSVCGKPSMAVGGWGMCRAHYRRERLRLLKGAAVEFMGGRCSICNQSFPLAAYDFHHVDMTTKEGSPGAVLASRSLATIADELSKCVLVCANCHRVLHAE